MASRSPDPQRADGTRRGFLARLGALAGGGLAAFSAPRVFATPAEVEGSGLPFIGEIKIVAFNYAPVGWLSCNGQLVSIVEFETLFFLIGTTYGGDGQNTFAIPDLRGRFPLHAGPGFQLGQSGGEAMASVLTTQLPAHGHVLHGDLGIATSAAPANAMLARDPAAIPRYSSTPGGAPMAASAVASAGAGQQHNNMPPYQALHFIIATEGVFPSPA